MDPGYNTADASLWYVRAVGAYDEATGDRRLADGEAGCVLLRESGCEGRRRHRRNGHDLLVRLAGIDHELGAVDDVGFHDGRGDDG